eukprot:CAMPEP_0168610502 /NCGR_PEP_ID=MMETSP0449_2-20121227/1822_1 /TAXON_ID=1082188 /ORGANISM="Strombidium rassoulzadegani, Strain ras09" /LENGTH=161 /DNA_ID=CAMNT_0008650813 /DNA_START=190 /DNA_END=672 /DNA_ORIENTATION=-
MDKNASAQTSVIQKREGFIVIKEKSKNEENQSSNMAKVNHQFGKRALISNFSSAVAVTLLYPLEVHKTRSQLQGEINGQNEYTLRGFMKSVRGEGFQAMYRGYSISVFCIPLFNTIYFPTYEFFKHQCRAQFDWESDSTKLYSVSAGLAGIVCNIATNPLW